MRCDIRDTIGKRLAAMMLLQRISLNKLGRLTGLSSTAILNIVRGDHVARASKVWMIAMALNCKVSDIVGR